MGNNAKHPPYHLRTNKAVDRLMLVKAISSLGEETYKQSTYYTLAGPYLEDLRMMDHFFPEMELTSLEENFDTYKRQIFHKFSSRIKLMNISFKEFLIHQYEPKEFDIFWLDYTGLTPGNFDEFQMVLQRVIPGSIIRITLRAEPEINLRELEMLPDENIENLKKQINEKYHKEFNSLLPNPAPNFLSTRKDFAIVVQYMIRQAASQTLDTVGSDVDFLPIQSSRYSDNTQMVSLTGILCEREKIDETKAKIQANQYANFEWNEPDLINIPALSLKERIYLEEYLPYLDRQDAGEFLQGKLGYLIDKNSSSSKDQCANYAKYHRDYPNFIRILY